MAEKHYKNKNLSHGKIKKNQNKHPDSSSILLKLAMVLNFP